MEFESDYTLRHIFEYVHPAVYSSLSRVCKRWRALTIDDLFWSNWYLNYPWLIQPKLSVFFTTSGAEMCNFKSDFIESYVMERRWRTGKFRSRKVVQCGDRSFPSCAHLLNNTFAYGTTMGEVRICNTSPNLTDGVNLPYVHSAAVRAVKLYDDLVVSGGFDSVKVFHLNSRKTLYTVKGANCKALAIQDSTLVSSQNELLVVHDLQGPQIYNIIDSHTQPVIDVVLKDHVLVSMDPFNINVHDMRTSDCVLNIKEESPVDCLQYTGKDIVYNTPDGIEIVDVRTGTSRHVIESASDLVFSIFIENDKLVYGDDSYHAKIWDISRFEHLCSIETTRTPLFLQTKDHTMISCLRGKAELINWSFG